MTTGGEGRPRWVFYAHNHLSEPALAEVLEAAVARGGVDVAFVADERLPRLSWEEALAEREVPAGEARARRWDLVLATDNQRGESVPGGTRVRLPHGAAYGLNAYNLLSLGRCDAYVATSEGHRDFLERNRARVRSSASVIVGGHPRLDRLLRRRRERDDVLRDLGLDPARPTLGVVSHWTPEGNLRRFGAALPRAVLGAVPGANVLVTGHPNLWARVRYDIGDPGATLLSRAVRRVRREIFPFDYDALFGGLARLADEEPRFRLLAPERTFDLLSAADALVADGSSVTVEFTLFDRPIVLGLPPGLRPLEESVERAYRAAADSFGDLDGLGPAVRSALGSPGGRRAARAALRDLCLAHREESGARIVDALLDWIGTGGAERRERERARPEGPTESGPPARAARFAASGE